MNSLFSMKEKREESIRLRPKSIKNPITTLLFFYFSDKKYYDGPVALYIYFICDSAIPKFLFLKKKRKKKDSFSVLFHNINIVNSLWCEKKKVCDAEMGPRQLR